MTTATFERQAPGPGGSGKTEKQTLRVVPRGSLVDIYLSVNGVTVKTWTKTKAQLQQIIEWGGWRAKKGDA